MNTKDFGIKLKSYRAKRGLTIQECATQIGISSKYLSDIERGMKAPRLETLILILNTLTASADDVLQDSLIVGYQAKSNDLMNKLSTLDVTRRKQVLTILSKVIETLSNN